VVSFIAFFVPHSCDAAEATALQTQISNLTNALGSAAPSDVAAASAALNQLLVRIGQIDCAAAAADNIDCKVTEVNSLGVAAGATLNAKNLLTVDQSAKLWLVAPILGVPVKDSDQALISSLNFAASLSNSMLTQPGDVASGLAKLVNVLSKSLIAAGPPKTGAATTISSLNTAISNLNAVVTKFGGKTTAQIQVRGAWYGDLAAIRYALKHGRHFNEWSQDDRLCSATRAVRARCQGQAQCYQPPSGSGTNVTTEINGTSYCGYEPAPFAAPKRKGLIISYDCVPPEQATPANTIVEDDKIPPDLFEKGSNDAQLRTGVIASVVCQANSGGNQTTQPPAAMTVSVPSYNMTVKGSASP
jgi:hypothetical protein